MKITNCIIALLLLIFPLSLIQAQSGESQKTKPKLSAVYVGLGAGPGTPGTTIGTSATFLLSNNWGGSIHYKSYSYEAPLKPSDYQPGLNLFGSSNGPMDHTGFASAMLVREFPTKTPLIRFGAEAGPSYVRRDQNHFIPNENQKLFSPNYLATNKISHSVGATARGKVEFPLTRFVGLECAAVGHLSPISNFAGGEIYLTFGKVRERL